MRSKKKKKKKKRGSSPHLFCNFSTFHLPFSIFHLPFYNFPFFSLPLFFREVSRNFPVRSRGGGTLPPACSPLSLKSKTLFCCGSKAYSNSNSKFKNLHMNSNLAVLITIIRNIFDSKTWVVPQGRKKTLFAIQFLLPLFWYSPLTTVIVCTLTVSLPSPGVKGHMWGRDDTRWEVMMFSRRCKCFLMRDLLRLLTCWSYFTPQWSLYAHYHTNCTSIFIHYFMHSDTWLDKFLFCKLIFQKQFNVI